MKRRKLFTMIAAVAMALNLSSTYAVEIPYLPMKGNIEGTVVDPSAFELPAGDFTLEAECASGAEVVICGVYVYTTQTSGKVRFSRRGGSLYVYEGNAYKMIFGAPTELPVSGLINVSSATLVDGTAYAPELTLGEGDCFDMTAYVVNPNFDTDVKGWTTTTGATSKRGSGVVAGEAIDGPGGYWQNWKGSPFMGKMYQTISGLPSGKYKLRAAAYTDKQADHEWMYLYLNDSRTAVTNSVSDFYEVTGVAVGTIEIGLDMTEAVPTLVGLDNVRLYYYGSDISVLVEKLKGQINEAKGYASQKMNVSIAYELNTVIAEAEAVTADPTEAAIDEVAVKLKDALAVSKVSIDAYTKLKQAIDAASVTLSSSTEYPGFGAFEAVVTEVTAGYDAATLEGEQIDASIQSMKDAEIACLLTQPAPFEATFAIVNPNFEDGGLKGWTNAGMQTQSNTSFPLKDGSIYVEKWIAYPGILADASISQTVRNLPNGVYRVTAFARAVQSTDPATPAEGGYLFAGDRQTQVGADGEYEVLDVAVVDNTLTLGFKTESTTANWVAVDNFKLYYVGYDKDVAIQALELQKSQAYDYKGLEMQKSVSDELDASVAEAEEILESSDPGKENLEKVSVRLSAAVKAAKESAEAYEELLLLLMTMEDGSLEEYKNYSGYSTFLAVHTEVEGLYYEYSLDVAGVNAAVERLKDAESACLLTQPAPFDATFALKNPDFEEGSNSVEGVNIPIGWQLEQILGGSKDVKLSSAIPSAGIYKYNLWASAVTSINLYQELRLPGGEYTVNASIRTDSEGNVTDQHLYARVGENTPAVSETLTYVDDTYWQALSLNFTVPAGGATVRLGAASTGTGTNAGWFQIDDFHLTCHSTISSVTAPWIDAASFSVIGLRGGVILINESGDSLVNIYTVDGRLVQSIKVANGETSIPFVQGTYIVQGKKVIVQ